MNNKQNIYLDKVVEFLVRDTKIDFKGKEIFLPLYILPLSFSLSQSYLTLSLPLTSFSKYSKEVYGLTDQEIEYVWKEYKSIIKDKINEG